MKTTLGRRWLSLLLTFVLCLSLSPTAWAADTYTVTVTSDKSEIIVGQTAKVTAAVEDSAGTEVSGATVSWTSDKMDVATVGADGTVTAVAAGGRHYYGQL